MQERRRERGSGLEKYKEPISKTVLNKHVMRNSHHREYFVREVIFFVAVYQFGDEGEYIYIYNFTYGK